MNDPISLSRPPRAGACRICGLVLLVLSAAAACTPTREGGDIDDPYEAQNRRVHAFNLKVDRLFFRGRGAGSVPRPLREGVANVADNLGVPSAILNDVLQGNGEDAGHNAFRFVLNTTLGIGGIFDPASSFGLEERDSDFGETLYVWGAPEGVYLELPLIGPSTQRAAAGRVVDLVLNPLNYVLNGEERIGAAAIRVIGRASDRLSYGDAVDSVLYESADSYAQARSLYLQNRRFDLGQDTAEDFYDPYEDPYAN